MIRELWDGMVEAPATGHNLTNSTAHGMGLPFGTLILRFPQQTV